MMRRMVVAVMSILLLAVPALAQETRTLPETFVSRDERLTLRYPSGWVVGAELAGEAIISTDESLFEFDGSRLQSGEAALLMVFPTVNEYFIDTEDIYVSGQPVVTLNHLVDSLVAETTDMVVEFPEAAATTLGGDDAAVTSGMVGDNDAVLILIDYGGDHFSFMVGVVSAGDLQKYLPKFLAIAASANYAF